MAAAHGLAEVNSVLSGMLGKERARGDEALLFLGNSPPIREFPRPEPCLPCAEQVESVTWRRSGNVRIPLQPSSRVKAPRSESRPFHRKDEKRSPGTQPRPAGNARSLNLPRRRKNKSLTFMLSAEHNSCRLAEARSGPSRLSPFSATTGQSKKRARLDVSKGRHEVRRVHEQY